MTRQSAPSSRSVAVKIVGAILSDKVSLTQALQQTLDLDALQPADRAFARLLVTTVLRRLGEIDGLLARRLKKPIAADAASVHDILRLGVAQLVFLKTPPHAAVDTAVDLAKSTGFGGFSGLVNAVLRRLSDSTPRTGEEAAHINTPKWLRRRWRNAYGITAANEIAIAHLNEPPLDITVKSGGPDLAEELDAAPLPNGSLRRKSASNIIDLPGFKAGDWWVQDAAASLPIRLLGALDGKTVIDLCAAPGGKTAQLADAGAKVIAIDNIESRIDRLQENLQRLNFDVETVLADTLTWRPTTQAEVVLLDAPCTATGTIRRHPDILHTKTLDDIHRLAGLQTRLISAAAEMVAPFPTAWLMAGEESTKLPATISVMCQADENPFDQVEPSVE